MNRKVESVGQKRLNAMPSQTNRTVFPIGPEKLFEMPIQMRE